MEIVMAIVTENVPSIIKMLEGNMDWIMTPVSFINFGVFYYNRLSWDLCSRLSQELNNC
jgi:hypothetical protein